MKSDMPTKLLYLLSKFERLNLSLNVRGNGEAVGKSDEKVSASNRRSRFYWLKFV